MSSTGGNPDKPLELIQKTYHLQATTATNNTEFSSHNRPSVVKVSNHQPSRKTSVHDVQEATREDFNRVKLLFSNIRISFIYLLNVDGRRNTRRSCSFE
jgi:hypothetical protein